MVELLIVLAIGAILAAIAVPSMRDLLNTTRQSSALGLIVNDLNQARGEAIKRNSRVLMCVRNPAGDDCVPSVPTPVNWQEAGWVVCIEGAVAEQCALSTAADPNPVIVVRPPLDASLTLSSSVAVARFSSNSAASAVAEFDVSGVWDGAIARKVCLLRTGNIMKLPPLPATQVCPL